MRRQRWRAAARVAAVLGVAAGLGFGGLGAGLAVGPVGAAGAQEEGSDVTSVVAAPELTVVVAEVVVADGTYVEEGAEVDAEDLAAVRERITEAGQGWGIVALSTPPPRGTRNFVANLLAEVRPRDRRIDTVLVITREDVAGASRQWDDAAIDAALAEAIPELEVDPAGGWEQVYEQLVGTPLPGDEGGDRAGVPVRWLAVGAVVVTVVSMGVAGLQLRQRTRERGEERELARL